MNKAYINNPLGLPKVKDFYSSYNESLVGIFDMATKIPGTQNDHYFDHIYIPLRIRSASGLPDLETTVDIGLDTEQLAAAYWTYNGECYLNIPGYLSLPPTEVEFAVARLARQAKSVFEMNKHKYLKLIELWGFSYNPLFNVDGIEIRQHLANEGVNDVKTQNKSQSGNKVNNFNAVGGNVKTTHNVAPYDTTVTKEEYNDTTVGQDTISVQEGGVSYDENGAPSWSDNATPTTLTGNASTNHNIVNSFTGENGETETTYTHNNAKNIVDGAEEDYTVESKDTAFGYALVGGDKMEVEKLIRQGNIGVTKTQELIEAERESLRFNIIQEFFDDLNKVILVGVYDN